MATNFLESLIAEWLEYKGMWVRTNVWVGPLAKGGYECELDVVAINLQEKQILHYEPSWTSAPGRTDPLLLMRTDPLSIAF